MILHVDMDAFFAAVEQHDRPELIGKCVIIGSHTRRGVVSAASYEARKFGVHSAMPMYEAMQRCPHGIFLKPRMQRYREASATIMSVLTVFSPLVEPVSIDEAYMDIAGSQRLFGPPLVLGRALKVKILAAVGLSCSVGIAPNKFLAKIASDMNKPDGLTLIMPEQVADLIDGLPVSKVPGVGKTRLAMLEKMGILLLGDVKKYPTSMLERRLGGFGLQLSNLAKGRDDDPVVPEHSPKSVRSEHTLDEDTRDRRQLNAQLKIQCEAVGGHLRKLSLKARHIVLKIKFADFSTITHRKTLPVGVQSVSDLHATAFQLLEEFPLTRKIRLIGVSASGLVPEHTPVQLELFGANRVRSQKWETVDHVLDAISEKYGKKIVMRASLKNSIIKPDPKDRS